MESALTGKTILITGGTSRLGSAFVRRALKAGAKVGFTFFQNRGQAAELEAAGAEGFTLDLTDSEACQAFCRDYRGRVKVLDAVIHNAAMVRDHTIQNMSVEDWDAVMHADLRAPYLITKELLSPLFKKARGGEGPAKVFMITSRAAVRGGFGVSNYAAAKAGLIALAQSLAQELGKKNVLVNAVNPGFMLSGMTESLPEMVRKHHRDLSPLDRYSDPEEVAGFLVWLCSDAMTQATGQVFHFESRKI